MISIFTYTYTQVYEASVEDFLRLAGVGGGANSGGGGAKDKVYVARMQGLPYRATEMEIVSVQCRLLLNL